MQSGEVAGGARGAVGIEADAVFHQMAVSNGFSAAIGGNMQFFDDEVAQDGFPVGCGRYFFLVDGTDEDVVVIAGDAFVALAQSVPVACDVVMGAGGNGGIEGGADGIEGVQCGYGGTRRAVRVVGVGGEVDCQRFALRVVPPAGAAKAIVVRVAVVGAAWPGGKGVTPLL